MSLHERAGDFSVTVIPVNFFNLAALERVVQIGRDYDVNVTLENNVATFF